MPLYIKDDEVDALEGELQTLSARAARQRRCTRL